VPLSMRAYANSFKSRYNSDSTRQTGEAQPSGLSCPLDGEYYVRRENCKINRCIYIGEITEIGRFRPVGTRTSLELCDNGRFSDNGRFCDKH
jgi:hypothetical protein